MCVCKLDLPSSGSPDATVFSHYFLSAGEHLLSDDTMTTRQLKVFVFCWCFVAQHIRCQGPWDLGTKYSTKTAVVKTRFHPSTCISSSCSIITHLMHTVLSS